jgi:CDP-paratose 2-epimerase
MKESRGPFRKMFSMKRAQRMLQRFVRLGPSNAGRIRNEAMRYLITGGAGFIGCSLAAYYAARGDRVTVLDNFSRRGSLENARWLHECAPRIRIVHGDIRFDHEHRLAREVEEHEVVVHLAGQVAVTTSVAQPREDFAVNALGTFNVLESVRQSSNRPIVLYASTNKVYGKMEDVAVLEEEKRYMYKDFPGGISEEQRLDFHSPYGCSKGIGDQYVRDYARIYGLRTVVFRKSCIYGPRQFGIEDQGWVAWFVIASVLGKPITIYGNGKQVRDILFIEDLVRAYDLAVGHIDVTSGHVYNIGGGMTAAVSLLELLDELERIAGRAIARSFADCRPGDQPVYISNTARAKRDFGWEPRVSVREGLEKLYAWVAENRALFE